MSFKDRNSRLRAVYEAGLLIVGCVIYALSMVYVNQIEVIPGSMLGLAVTANSIFGTPIGAVNLLLNIPVMIFVTKKRGLKVLIYTVIIMAGTSALMDLWAWMTPETATASPLLISVLGGAAMGVGAGMLIASGGTMAGTTALALLAKRRISRLSYGTILFIMDCAIMLLCALILRSWSAIVYSALYGFIVAKVMDLMIWADKKITARLFAGPQTNRQEERK